MSNITAEERAGATVVYPAGYTFDEFEQDPRTMAENEEFEKFRQAMRDTQDEAYIQVGRKLVDKRGRSIGQKTMECFTCGIDEHTFPQLCQRIREDYGTGIYRIVGRDSSGKFKFNKTIGIQAPLSDDNSPDGNNVGDIIDRVSDMMERQSARMEFMLNGRPQSDGVDTFVKLATVLTPIITPLLAGLNKPAPSLGDQIKEMMLMKKFIGDFDGSAENGDGNLMGLLTATVNNIGPLLGAALQAGQQTGAVNAEGIIQPQKGIPHMTTETPQGPVISEADQALIAQHKMSVSFLLTQAKGGAQPHDVAVWIVDQINDDDKLTELENFLGRDDALRLCTLAVPEVTEHLKWFTDFQTFALSEIAQEFDMYSDDDESDLTAADGESKQAESVAGDKTTETDATKASTDGNATGDP